MLAFTVEAALVTLRWRQESRGGSIRGQTGLRYRISWILSNINSSFSGIWGFHIYNQMVLQHSAVTSDAQFEISEMDGGMRPNTARLQWNNMKSFRVYFANIEVSESCKIAEVCKLCLQYCNI